MNQRRSRAITIKLNNSIARKLFCTLGAPIFFSLTVVHTICWILLGSLDVSVIKLELVY